MYSKEVLCPDIFEGFIPSTIFDKMVFCLGEKEGMQLNGDCSSCYCSIGDPYVDM